MGRFFVNIYFKRSNWKGIEFNFHSENTILQYAINLAINQTYSLKNLRFKWSLVIMPGFFDHCFFNDSEILNKTINLKNISNNYQCNLRKLKLLTYPVFPVS